MTSSSATPRHALPLRRPPSPSGGTSTAEWGGGPTEPAQVPMAWVQGTLALDLHGTEEDPAPPLEPTSDRAGLSLVPSMSPDSLRELEAWAARFAQAALEVLGGDRPVSQLLRWTSVRVYQDLDRRARILGRTAPAPRRQRSVRPQVRSVHVFQPRPDVAEVSIHVRHGQRSRALAARLEEHDAHWRCVALQLG